jgi:uncharacterized protein
MTDEAEALLWAAGPAGAGWFEMAAALAGLAAEAEDAPAVRVVAGGGLENPLAVAAGTIQLGMSVDFLVAAAHAGAAPYAPPTRPRITILGRGWSALPFHLIGAREIDAGIEHAIRAPGFRIAVPPLETSDELTFRRVVGHYGTSYEAIRARGGTVLLAPYLDIADAFVAGRVDFLFGATTLPAAIIRRIAEGSRPAALLPLPDGLRDHLSTAGYTTGVIPGGTYPEMQSGDVPTAFMETVVMVAGDLPDDMVARLTRALLRDVGRLRRLHPALAGFDPGRAQRDPPAPLHPGAGRVYRELGFAETAR